MFATARDKVRLPGCASAQSQLTPARIDHRSCWRNDYAAKCRTNTFVSPFSVDAAGLRGLGFGGLNLNGRRGC